MLYHYADLNIRDWYNINFVKSKGFTEILQFEDNETIVLRSYSVFSGIQVRYPEDKSSVAVELGMALNYHFFKTPVISANTDYGVLSTVENNNSKYGLDFIFGLDCPIHKDQYGLKLWFQRNNPDYTSFMLNLYYRF